MGELFGGTPPTPRPPSPAVRAEAQRRATPDVADLVMRWSASAPWMDARTVAGLIVFGKIDPDSDTGRAIAEAEARRQAKPKGVMGFVKNVVDVPSNVADFVTPEVVEDKIGNVTRPIGGAILTGGRPVARGVLTGAQSLYETGQGLVRNTAAQFGRVGEIAAGVVSGAAAGAAIGGAGGLIGGPLAGFTALGGAVVGGVLAGGAVALADPDVEGEANWNVWEWSTGGLALEKLLERERVDLGHGWFGAGSLAERQRELSRNVTIGGGSLTPGRLLASTVVEPGTEPYNFASGLIDATIALGPVEPGAATLRAIGAVNAGRKTVVAREAAGWLASRTGRKVVDKMAQVDDVNELWHLTGKKIPVRVLNEIADTNNPQRVTEILADELGISFKEKPNLPRLPQVNRTMRRVRLLQQMPGEHLDTANLDRAFRTFDAAQRNARLPEDIIARNNNMLARARTPGEMYRVVVEQFLNEDLARQIALHTADTRRGREMARKLTTAWANHHDELTRYAVDEIGENMIVPGAVLDGAGKAVPTPHLDVEYLQGAIPLPDAREVRRATSTLGRLASNNVVDTPITMLDWYQNTVWKPVALIRGAWTVRVIGEEQIRMAASGMSSLFHHPISHIALVAGKRGRVGIEGDDIMESAEGVAALAKGSAGWRDSSRIRTGAKIVLDRDRDATVFARGWGDELAQLHSSPVAKRLAGGVEWAPGDTIGARTARIPFTKSTDRIIPDEVRRSAPSPWREIYEQWRFNGHTYELVKNNSDDVGPAWNLSRLDDEGRVIADAEFDLTSRGIEVHQVYVPENLRRQGYNKELTEALEDMARGEGLDLYRTSVVNPVQEGHLRRAGYAQLDEGFVPGSFGRYSDVMGVNFVKRYGGRDVVGGPIAATGNHLEDTKVWLKHGKGRKLREDLESMGAPVHTDAELDVWVDSVFRRLEIKTGGDTELLDLVATGKLGTEGLTVKGKQTGRVEVGAIVRATDRNNYGRVESINGETARVHFISPEGTEATVTLPLDALSGVNRSTKLVPQAGKISDAVLDALEAKRLEGIGPQKVKGDYVLTARMSSGQKVGDKLDRAAEFMFSMLMTKPTNWLSRSPAFRQFYWQKVQELMPVMDSTAQARALERARDAKIGRFDDYEKSASRGNGTLTGADVDEYAKAFALDETRKLLYDLSNRSQFFDVHRLLFPFGEAWKEILTTWARLGVEHPQTAHRAQQVITGGREAEPDDVGLGGVFKKGKGFFYQDANGDEVFAFPGTGWLSDKVIGAPIPLTGRLEGLSIATSLIPAFGPAVQHTVGKFIPHTPDWDWARQIMFPFGEPSSDEGFVESHLPAWMQKIRTSGLLRDIPGLGPVLGVLPFVNAQPSEQQDRALAEAAWGILAWQVTSGERPRPSSIDEIQAAVDENMEKARRLYFLRGIAQLGAPTAPTPEMLVMDKDGRLHVLNELRNHYREMADDEAAGGWATADERFLNLYGENVLWAMTSGSTTTSYGLPVTTEGDQWVRDHPDVKRRFKNTYGLWAPEGDESDMTAYGRQFESGDREGLTTEQRVLRANETLGRFVYEQVARAAGPSPNAAQRALLRAARDRLAEEFPGFGMDIAGIAKRTDLKTAVAELRRGLRVPDLATSDAGKGLSLYLEIRDVAIAKAQQMGYQSFGQADDTEPLRQMLRMAADAILAEHPGFGRMWDEVFSREMEEEVTEQKAA